MGCRAGRGREALLRAVLAQKCGHLLHHWSSKGRIGTSGRKSRFSFNPRENFLQLEPFRILVDVG